MGLFNRVRSILHRFLYLNRIERRLINNLILQGKILHQHNISNKEEILADIKKAEFRVFSQWGDDGIIQFLVDYLDISNKTFIEFGVENYQEANTRFLLLNNQWKGLVLDGDVKNVNSIIHDEIYWKYDLNAVNAFITKENINDIILRNGFEGEIGLLSIDIDGNDYWVWEAITVIDPLIVVIEYNAIFRADRSITVPYQAHFNRTQAHYSNLYFGASIQALCELAEMKGYSFIGCTSSGNNAYFVQKTRTKELVIKSPQEGFVNSFSRESRDKSGKLTYAKNDQRLELIKGEKVINVLNGQEEVL